MTNPPPPGAPYSSAASAASAPGGQANPAGRIALIFAIVAVAFGLVQQVVSQLIPYIMYNLNLGTGAVGGIFSIFTVLHVLLSAGALAFGWVGASRRGAPHLTSGIGLGVGAAGVISGLVALVSGPILGLLIS